MPESEINTDDWARPIFAVRDLRASLDYYCDRLGFELRWAFGGPENRYIDLEAGEPLPNTLVIAEVIRNGIEIILDQSSSHPHVAPPSIVAAEMHDYSGLGKLYETFRAAGARFHREPFKVDWADETFQLEVEDLDGNILIYWGNYGTG